MSVLPDADGAWTDFGSSTGSVTYTGLTVGAGLINGYLIASIPCGVTAPGITGVTWNGVAMTLLVDLSLNGTNQAADLQYWGLANPASGNKNLVVSFSTTNVQIKVQASSFQGVAQTSSTTTNTVNTGDGTTSISLPISSAAGNYTHATVTCASGPPDINDISPGLIGTLHTGARSVTSGKATGASTVTYSTTTTGSSFGGLGGVAVNLIAVVGPPPTITGNTLPLMGIG